MYDKQSQRLTPEEEQQLFKVLRDPRAPESAKQIARETIVRKCQGYVIQLSRRYAQRGVEIEDLIQEANIGVMQAIERFDLEKGFRFLTYADDWIRRALGRAAEEKGSINIYQVRTPCYIYLVIGRINKNMDRLRIEYGREPTNAELAKACSAGGSKVTESTVEQALLVMRRGIESLDRTVDTGEGSASISETIADDPSRETQNIIQEHESATLMTRALKRLTPLERKVIELRFGLNGNEKHTQDAVWKELNINRAKVATIQQRALNKLRGMPEMKDLVDVIA